MESRIWISAVVLVLASAINSGDALACHECKSVGSADDSCSGEMLKSVSHMPIECSLATMQSWHNKMQLDPTLNRISSAFDVYKNKEMTNHHEPHTPMACIKIMLRVGNQPVILRTCQTDKIPGVDPCKTTRDKIAKADNKSTTVLTCDMCDTDKCNGSYALSPVMIMAIVPLIASILMTLRYSSA